MEIALVPWEERFAPALAEYANNPNVFANLRDRFPHPYTEKDARDYIRLCADEDGRALCRQRYCDGGRGYLPPQRRTGLFPGGALLGEGHYDLGGPGDLQGGL